MFSRRGRSVCTWLVAIACVGLGAASCDLASATSSEQVRPAHVRRAAERLAALKSDAASTPASYDLDSGIAKWYRDRGATAPLTDTPVYCHGYGCEFQTPVVIDAAALSTLQHLFAGHQATAAEERKAISEAVRWWERRASPLLGGPPREHRSDIGHAHHLGATDCIDEATNSTTILVILERHGLLKHHVVQRPVSRGFIVNAHSTAVIQETGGDTWVVDMWMHNMGEAPDIMTEARWYSEA